MRIYKVARRSPGRANRLSAVTRDARVSQLRRWIVSRYPIRPVGIRPRWILAVLIKFHSWSWTTDKTSRRRSIRFRTSASVSFIRAWKTRLSKESAARGTREILVPAWLFSGKHTFHSRFNIYRLSTRDFNTIRWSPSIVYIHEIDYQSDKWKWFCQPRFASKYLLRSNVHVLWRRDSFLVTSFRVSFRSRSREERPLAAFSTGGLDYCNEKSHKSRCFDRR